MTPRNSSRTHASTTSPAFPYFLGFPVVKYRCTTDCFSYSGARERHGRRLEERVRACGRPIGLFRLRRQRPVSREP